MSGEQGEKRDSNGAVILDGVKNVQNQTNKRCKLIDSGSDVFALSGTSVDDLVAIDLPCKVNLKSQTIEIRDPQHIVNPWAVDSVDIRSDRRVRILSTDYIVNGLSISHVKQDAPYVGRRPSAFLSSLSPASIPAPEGERHQLQVHNQFGKLKFQHTPVTQGVWVEMSYDFVDIGANSFASNESLKSDDRIEATVRIYGVPVGGREQSFTYSSFDTLYTPLKITPRRDEVGTTHELLPTFKSSCLILKINDDPVALARDFRREPERYSIEFRGTSWGNSFSIKRMTVSDMIKEAKVFEEGGGVLPVSDSLWLVMPLLNEDQLVHGNSGDGLKWWNLTNIDDINSLMFCGAIDTTELNFTRNDGNVMEGFTRVNFDCYWWQYNTYKTVHNKGAWVSMFDIDVNGSASKDAMPSEHRLSEGVGALYC